MGLPALLAGLLARRDPGRTDVGSACEGEDMSCSMMSAVSRALEAPAGCPDELVASETAYMEERGGSEGRIEEPDRPETEAKSAHSRSPEKKKRG